MKKLILTILIALTVSGCAVFQSFQNPISTNQLAVIESTYGIALSAAVAYRNTRLCKKGEVATVTNICAYRNVILQLQAADRQAKLAITNARNFIKNNPTLSAYDVIQVAQAAVDAFKAIQVQYGIN